MWKAYITKWNGHSFFLDSYITSSPDLKLYTDAASTVGFGGHFNGRWFQGRWPPHLLIDKSKGISIEWQVRALPYRHRLCTVVPPVCRQTPSVLVR